MTSPDFGKRRSDGIGRNILLYVTGLTSSGSSKSSWLAASVLIDEDVALESAEGEYPIGSTSRRMTDGCPSWTIIVDGVMVRVDIVGGRLDGG